MVDVLVEKGDAGDGISADGDRLAEAVSVLADECAPGALQSDRRLPRGARTTGGVDAAGQLGVSYPTSNVSPHSTHVTSTIPSGSRPVDATSPVSSGKSSVPRCSAPQFGQESVSDGVSSISANEDESQLGHVGPPTTWSFPSSCRNPGYVRPHCSQATSRRSSFLDIFLTLSRYGRLRDCRTSSPAAMLLPPTLADDRLGTLEAGRAVLNCIPTEDYRTSVLILL